VVEVKAKKFYKVIHVPGNIDVEKASSKYNNGVLTVIIPKKERILGKIYASAIKYFKNN